MNFGQVHTILGHPHYQINSIRRTVVSLTHQCSSPDLTLMITFFCIYFRSFGDVRLVDGDVLSRISGRRSESE